MEVRDHEWALPVMLSFISAFVDAICYLGLFRTFTAFITGTLIVLATEVVQTDGEFVTKIVVTVSFIASLFVWVLLIQHLFDRRNLRTILLATEAILLALYMICGVLLSPLSGADSAETIVLAIVAVLAMSLQNAVMVLILHAHMPTTIMTGNLTRFIINTIDFFGLGKTDAPHDREAIFKTRRQLRHYSFVLGAFLVGALAGAYGYVQWGFLVLACPVLLLLALAVWCFDRD